MRGLPILLGLFLAAGCSQDSPADPAAAPKPAGGSRIGARCLDCHADVVRDYRRTGMANAAGPIGPGELEGLAAVRDAQGWSYRFEKAPRGWRIRETAPGGDPTVARDLEFAIGAGLIDRSYVASVGDLMWFAPLEVVGSGGVRRAALAPGHAIRPGTRFTIPITEECLACHTDRLPARDDPLNLRPDPESWQPEGISCAACHGDVEGHAEWREGDFAGARKDSKDPVLAASRAGWIESLSLCARCHLQGDASLLLAPRARGIPPPGGDMLADRAVFVAETQTDEVGFVSQVERLVRSRCFTESNRSRAEEKREPLTCISCHDPHRSSFDPKERAVVRDACAKCHGTAEGSCSMAEPERRGADCVSCHMRRTGVFDVADVWIHDHWIRRRPAPPSPPAELRVKESKDGKLVCFAWPGAGRPAYAEDPGLRMMAGMSVWRADLALPFALREPGPTASALATYHHLRGSLFEGSERPAEARAAYERALALDPGHTETAVNLGLLLGRLGSPREGIAVLDRSIAEHPKAAGALRNRALLHLQLGDANRFAADLETAFAISPEAALARALADHHRQAGREDLAARWMREWRTLEPPPR